MSVNYESVNRINSLKSNIETITGKTYGNLTDAIQGLKDECGIGEIQSYLDGTISGEVDLSHLTKVRIGILAECDQVTGVMLPTTITEIPPYAFYNCRNLENIAMPSGITRIGSFAFYQCDKFTNIIIPESVTEIFECAFMNCYNLTNLVIPNSVEWINSQAFCQCTRLVTVTFKGTPEYIASNTFWNCRSLTTINVPWAEGEVYNAPWGATNATINYNYTGG